MKILAVPILSAVLCFFHDEKAPPPAPAPVAVVELFTAEGCSSCPAADELLKEMTGILQKEGKQVYALAFHVTYWDHLGWKDPYSQQAFTDRQKQYQKQLRLPQLYTPQAVVNGRYEFVGSNPVSFRQSVDSALIVNPTNIGITASAQQQGDSVRVSYALSKAPRAAIVNIAVVERNVEHHVLRGENKDRTLKHYHVVRSWESRAAQENGNITLAWPAELMADNASVIVYVQHRQSLRVMGAAAVPLTRL